MISSVVASKLFAYCFADRSSPVVLSGRRPEHCYGAIQAH
ncbi:MAG: hypothetical protein ACI915_004839 [Gammaproteobacteria bacterium]|jgi:hypothetical protein